MRQRKEGDTGDLAMAQDTEMANRENGMLAAASELKTMLIKREEGGKGKGGSEKSILTGPKVDAEGKAYSLAPKFLERAPARMDWERVDVLEYVGRKVYLEGGHLDLPL